MSRLREKFNKEILPELQKDLSIKNKMGVPKVEKVIVNMGVGEALENIKFLDAAQKELSLITGQWPAVGRARKSISTFKLRAGNPVGCYVTLRGERMYEFLDRLFNIILPRVRDFRGVSSRAFDGRGNYTLGIKDQLVFPEIDYTKVERTRGMNITIVTSAEKNQEAHLLLQKMGMPFAEPEGGR